MGRHKLLAIPPEQLPLEHLFKPKRVLKQFKALLKNQGEIIVSFPNIAWYGYRLEMLRGKPLTYYLFSSGEHIQQFTLDLFNKLLKEVGFTTVQMDGQFLGPNFLKPRSMFSVFFKRYPSLFGYQLVIKASLKKEKD